MSAPNIRENLVNTAVKFLQNPKVRESPEGQKKLFLEKKGLTNEEIELAIQRAGTATGDTSGGGNLAPQVVTALPPTPVAPPSSWSRFKDIAFTVTFIGGASYAIYRFIKRIVLPYLRGEDSTETKLKKMEKTLGLVQNNMTDMLGKMNATLTSIEAIMNKQQEKLQVVVHEVVDKQNSQTLVKYQDQQTSNEIKAELATVKSLLLNRRQFAAAPQTSPIIPAWQREVKKESADTVPQRSQSEEATGSSGSESGGSIEEKSSWVKIDASDRVSEEEPTEDIKMKTEETATPDPDVDGSTSQNITDEENVEKDGASVDHSEHITVEVQ